MANDEGYSRSSTGPKIHGLSKAAKKKKLAESKKPTDKRSGNA